MLECIDDFYAARNRNNKIFMFLIPPPPPPSGNAKIQKLIAKHIYSNALKKGKGKTAKSKYSRT